MSGYPENELHDEELESDRINYLYELAIKVSSNFILFSDNTNFRSGAWDRWILSAQEILSAHSVTTADRKQYAVLVLCLLGK